MFSTWLSTAAFNLRRLVRSQPFLCAAMAVTLALSIAAGAALISVHIANANAVAELRRIEQFTNNAPLPKAPVPDLRVSLQPFNSAQLVQAMNEVAAQVSLPLQEISFTLEDPAGVPYLRYRASLTVVAKYAIVRRFIDGIHAEVPDVSLDSLACKREAINAQPLECDLVFSAFYKVAGHG